MIYLIHPRVGDPPANNQNTFYIRLPNPPAPPRRYNRHPRITTAHPSLTPQHDEDTRFPVYFGHFFPLDTLFYYFCSIKGLTPHPLCLSFGGKSKHIYMCVWPWTKKNSIKSLGYICRNSQNYTVWVKIIDLFYHSFIHSFIHSFNQL